MTSTNAEQKIRKMPLDKSWGISIGRSARITVAHRASGEWALHCGWSVPDSHDDDWESIETVVSAHLRGPHMGVSAHYSDVEALLADYADALQALTDRRPVTPSRALRVSEFGTRTA